MPRDTIDNEALERLRRWRNRPEADLSLSFIENQFKRDVARPHKQLAQVVDAWQRDVPAELAAHTRLISLSRGVLKVGVDSASHLYQLDRLLREGLESRLISAMKAGSLRKVQLQRISPGETTGSGVTGP